MGQLESLWELNIAEPEMRKRKKESYSFVIHSNGDSMNLRC
jgi:hypothetical protein